MLINGALSYKGKLVIGKKCSNITTICCHDEDELGCLPPPEEGPPDSPSPQPTGPVPLETGQEDEPLPDLPEPGCLSLPELPSPQPVPLETGQEGTHTPPQPDHHYFPEFSKETFDLMAESEKTQFLDPPGLFD